MKSCVLSSTCAIRSTTAESAPASLSVLAVGVIITSTAWVDVMVWFLLCCCCYLSSEHVCFHSSTMFDSFFSTNCIIVWIVRLS